MEYKVRVGPKGVADLMRNMDLGVDGVMDSTLVCTLSTSSPFSTQLVETHKKALKEKLSEYYYVGRIEYVQ